MAHHIPWGNLTLHLDNEPFQHAYEMGREHYFDTCKDESHRVRTITVRQVLELVAILDGNGSYQFDDPPIKIEKVLGFLLGYMGGPWMSETPEERDAREHRYVQDTELLPQERILQRERPNQCSLH